MRSGKVLCWLVGSAISSVPGCARPPVEWSDAGPLSAELAAESLLTFDGETLSPALKAPSVAPPEAPGQCRGSARVARDHSTGDWYAAWWSARADSSADVLASHSSDGVTWRAPVRVDTADVGRVGCNRPPPSVAADSGNFYIVYAMTAREGPGIFASHTMDRGSMFHSPVAVVYGTHIGRAAIAAQRNVVAVAYEDPNTQPRRIALALSSTMGHLFQSRVAVSPPTGHAHAPAVALGGGRVAVTWLRGDSAGAGQRMMRVGVVR